MQFQINNNFLKYKNTLVEYIENFQNLGKVYIQGSRNSIKLFELEDFTINVKSFKEPNFINKVIYKYFRKSKAQRSFEYANFLLKHNIGTPKPIAYFENVSFLGLKDSYYVSEHLECDLTYRELVQTDYPDTDTILRQFTQFTFTMHEKGIEFLDHSPGNTLIVKRTEGTYDFYLVDLNRMKFHTQMNFETRMKNLSKITPKKEMVAVMSSEYAKLSGIDEDKVFRTMWNFTEDFQYRYYRKKRIKKRLKFWKKQ
jgi:hypothetical protein